MKKFIIVTLVVVNLGLLAGIMAGMGTPEAQASNGYYNDTNYTPDAARSASAMETLYIVDMASQQMAALKFDIDSKQLQGIGMRDLAVDFRGRGN